MLTNPAAVSSWIQSLGRIQKFLAGGAAAIGQRKSLTSAQMMFAEKVSMPVASAAARLSGVESILEVNHSARPGQAYGYIRLRPVSLSEPASRPLTTSNASSRR